MLNERKVAQMAAYLLRKRGGTMSHLKLMKLLYLCDREAMYRYQEPMTGDRMVSMKHGPVLSGTLNHMDGDVESAPDGWEAWISDKEDHQLSLRRQFHSIDELDELSEADIEILDDVWNRFGHMRRWDLRDYTHEHCAEWRDPNGSMIPIEYKDVFMALGYSEDQARELGARIEEVHRVDKLFASL